MSGDNLRMWRFSPTVRAFERGYCVSEPGGILRFEDIPVHLIQDIVVSAPAEVLEQASGDGPTLKKMLALAEQFEGTLGGCLTDEARTDTAFFCDTLIVPAGNNLGGLDADEVSLLPDGRTSLWWD